MRFDKVRLILGVSFLACASAQTATRQESVSIDDPWPLAKTAEILWARYGIPISYEDVSKYSYSADLADPVAFGAAHPDASLLPPRSSHLSFALEPLVIGNDPVRPADLTRVAKQLQVILDQHQSNGNPGRFKILETPAGLVITPTAVRDANGLFVADHSVLDARITFPEIRGESYLTFGALRDALQAATGKAVHIDILPGLSDPIRADNEPARDVLIRLLNGFHRSFGLMPADGSPPIEGSHTWVLTTDAGIATWVNAGYLLRFPPRFPSNFATKRER